MLLLEREGPRRNGVGHEIKNPIENENNKRSFVGVLLRPERPSSVRRGAEMSLRHCFTLSSKGWLVDESHASMSFDTADRPRSQPAALPPAHGNALRGSRLP